MMGPLRRMVPLRLVAILCVGAGIPYLTLATASEALRTAPIPLRFAPTLYLFTTAIGVALFLVMRSTTRASATVYSVCGAILGLVPWGVYQLSAIAAPGESQLLAMPLLVGAITGAAAGWTIWRGDDGFSRDMTRR